MSRKSIKKKLISICIPVLNEEQNIANLYSELQLLARKLNNSFNFEFIFHFLKLKFSNYFVQINYYLLI